MKREAPPRGPRNLLTRPGTAGIAVAGYLSQRKMTLCKASPRVSGSRFLASLGMTVNEEGAAPRAEDAADEGGHGRDCGSRAPQPAEDDPVQGFPEGLRE